jgi:hypothetical protein
MIHIKESSFIFYIDKIKEWWKLNVMKIKIIINPLPESWQIIS